MLEAPEAKVLAEQLQHTLQGKKVAAVVAGHTPHKFTWFSGDQQYYEKALLGKTVSKAAAYGGFVDITIGDMSLFLSDGVNIRYLAPGEKLPLKYQFLLGFGDESCIVISVRMYAGISCFPDGEPHDSFKPYYDAAKGKPQVMSDEFTKDYFLSLAGGPAMSGKSAKALLATQQTIPGLGNGVLQDILFYAGIHPKRKVSTLSSGEKEKLYAALKDTLGKMFLAGGRESESDIFGNKGRYAAQLSKDTAGHACTVCGSIIVKENYMGGSIYYCPGCQKL